MTGNEVINIDFFQKHGYLIYSGLIPKPIITGLREFLESNVDDALTKVAGELGGLEKDIPSSVRRLNDEGRLAELSQTAKSIMSGHFPLEVRLSPNFWEVPRCQSFRRMLEALIAVDKIFMHMPPAARFVLPGNLHAGVPAHQDAAYGSHMSDFITVWVPLVDIDEDCGGVAVFEASHEASLDVPQHDGEFWLRPLSTNGFRRVECRIKAGDALVLHKHVIHKSVGNRSDRTRLSVDFRFFGEGQSSSKHYLDLQTWEVVSPHAS